MAKIREEILAKAILIHERDHPNCTACDSGKYIMSCVHLARIILEQGAK